MEAVETKERIKVRADFTPGGKIVPIMFKRGQQDPLRVRKIHAVWEDRETQGRLLYFTASVEGSDDIFQLRYREKDRTWWLDCLMPGGRR